MIKIRVISLHGQPLAQEIAHDFDDLGGTLGRAETNQLALPDPQRHISRLQARVVCRAGHYELINQGANPINVNGRPIPNGSAVAIEPGARIEIGGYLMEAIGPAPAPVPRPPSQEVTISPEAFAGRRPAAASPMPRPAAARAAEAPQPAPRVQPVPPMPPQAPPAAQPPLEAPARPVAQPAPAAFMPSASHAPPGGAPVDDPLGLFGDGASPVSGDPLADLFGAAPDVPSAPAAPAAGPAQDPLAGVWTPPPSQPTEAQSLAELLAVPGSGGSQTMPSNRAPLIPDDFDPFADPFAAPPAPAEPQPLDDLEFGLAGKSGSASSIDSAYGLAPPAPHGSGDDPFLGSSLSDPLAGRGGDAPIDPLAAISGESVPPPAGFQSMPDQVPELHGSFAPPRIEPFAAPEPGAFAPPPGAFAPPPVPPAPPAPAAGRTAPEQFVSWQEESPARAPAAPPPVPAASQDPLLAMFDAPAAGGGGPLDALGLGITPAPADDMLSAFDAAPRRPSPQPEAGFAAPAPAGDDTLFGGIGRSPAPAPREPLVARAFAGPAPGAAAQAAGEPSLDALRRAFLAGLDAPTLPIDELTPELMERVGRLLREATQGTLDLLLARATTKREVRADVTMIVSTNNNPLKFSPDATAALLHLLVPQGQGFLSPVAAMQDAYDDLRSHQFGFMAGLRAALAGVLRRFDPAMLEQRLAQKSMLDNVLPMNRRAKLWDLYIQLYRDIASEAEDDFHTLFGREFLRAYQEQVDRLGKAKH